MNPSQLERFYSNVNQQQSTHGSLVFDQTLIITTKSGDKHKAMNTLEAMNPFLALGTLAPNVEHVVVQLSEFKKSLSDSCRTETGAKDILIRGQVAWREETVDAIVVACENESQVPGSGF